MPGCKIFLLSSALQLPTLVTRLRTTGCKANKNESNTCGPAASLQSSADTLNTKLFSPTRWYRDDEHIGLPEIFFVTFFLVAILTSFVSNSLQFSHLPFDSLNG